MNKKLKKLLKIYPMIQDNQKNLKIKVKRTNYQKQTYR